MDDYAVKKDDYRRLNATLNVIADFVKKHPKLTFIEFDYFVVHQMTLFAIEPNYDFELLAANIDLIKKAIPSIKRIFTKPIIVLNETNDVLPVENVRTINQDTLLHLANHSHNVANITSRGVMPRKLLTRIYQDDYSIYENVVFCNFIDQTLSYIRKSKRVLSNLLYINEIMSFNLLEKTNHLNYYLAIGKLHTGYIRDYSQYFTIAKKSLTELNTIQTSLQSYLKRNVYQKNKKRNKNLSLKKTNIFLSQKDYKKVYLTYKYLLNNVIIADDDIIIDTKALSKNYLSFIQILLIFSLSHLNFRASESLKISLTKINTTFNFKDWRIDVVAIKDEAIKLTFSKDINYSVLIVPDLFLDQLSKDSILDNSSDEVIFTTPFFKNYLERSELYLTTEDVESFRRFQQVILKGMIYSDVKRDLCPFCGHNLTINNDYYSCENCMTEIKKDLCLATNKQYYYTTMANYDISNINLNFSDDKKVEGQLFYRNITKINRDGNIVCPICNGLHL